LASAVRVRVARAAEVPDPVRLARYRHAPELGSRILFFSGGSALRGLSQKLIEYTHHSVHLITPFDSGGSSAQLRKAFHMAAVGDLRNRLMALADRTVLGNPEIYDLFAFRFPEDGDAVSLRAWLDEMIEGQEPQVRAIPEPLRSIVRTHLGFFRDAMPARFDLRGAAIGNLVLVGGYLNQGRELDPVLYLFSQLVEVRGIVRPVVDGDIHLVARLADGRRIVGQHLLTGREAPPLDAAIERLYLSRSRTKPREYRPRIPEGVDRLIRHADLICYPMGSFYTSVIATLLPAGISDAIAETNVPKVYVPNPGHDPEEIGLGLAEKVETLRRYLLEGAAGRVAGADLLQFVLLDAKACGLKRAAAQRIRKLGVEIVDVPLVTEASRPYLDDTVLAEALLSLV